MGIIKGIKALLSFYTTIPIGKHFSITEIAKYMPFSPFMGLFIGTIVGLFSWLLFLFLPGFIVGLLTYGFLLLLTGVHHIDGLFDFGDGVACIGTVQKKLEAMRDERVGAGGIVLGILVVLTTAITISHFEADSIVFSLMVSEVSAKQCMVFLAFIGKPTEGSTSAHFIEVMHKRRVYFLLTLALSFIIVFVILKPYGVLALILALSVTLLIFYVSNKHFGGLTGDVFGAANEVSRLASLLTLLVALR